MIANRLPSLIFVGALAVGSAAAAEVVMKARHKPWWKFYLSAFARHFGGTFFPEVQNKASTRNAPPVIPPKCCRVCCLL